MSQNEYLRKIAEGVVGFSGDMKIFTDEIRENLDKVLTRHYQANHTPYAVMAFEDEAHYWEETLAEAINRVEYPNYDDLEPKGVTMLQRRSYVIVRGNLKSGNTIHFDDTKFNQLYINGERYTGDYTFNGETPETYERLVVVAVQTPFNLGQKVYGDLEMTVADFPIENAEIFANVGTYSNLQPVIEELLEYETVESLYVRGIWLWCCRRCSFIKTLKVSDGISIVSGSSSTIPALQNYFIPNSIRVFTCQSYAIRNIDVTNCAGIDVSAFSNTKIKGHLYLNNKGAIADAAFSDCPYLTSVEIGDGVTSLSHSVFNSCPRLQTVIIGDGVTSFGSQTFNNCTALKTVHLGKSITNFFNNSAFNGCGNISNLTVSKGYHCGKTTINQSAVLDWRCFKEIVDNCAAPGEDGRTAATMTFKVHRDVFNEIDSASKYTGNDEQQIADKETALYILNLCTEKEITISQ